MIRLTVKVFVATTLTVGGCGRAWPAASPEQIAAARKRSISVAFVNSVGMRFVLIPAGTFMMGSDASDPMHQHGETLHKVTLTRPFYIAATEVTQAQYQAVRGTNPSAHVGPPDAPVEQVSTQDAEAFCAALGRRDGRTYRLPTEAQWEYACRAGSASRWCFGDDPEQLPDYARYGESEYGKRHHPVAGKKPNAWGLYDMHGNVWEWTTCYFVPYGDQPRVDPVGRLSPVGRGRERVIRGGAFCYQAVHVRSAMRYRDTPSDRHDIIGFRPIVVIDAAE